jgi:2-polyprenyl-3-methyl-5-hydroxy-6-metoxy-1,4-benzoquinol methylase
MTVCPACGGPLRPWSEVSDRITGLGRFLLHRCRDCLSLARFPQPVWSELAGCYPQDYWYRESDRSLLSRLEWRYRRWVLGDHVQFINGFLAPRARVLDVGCSSGTFLYLLRLRGHEVLGLDFSSEAAREAEARYGVPVKLGSLEERGAELKSWLPDAVTLFHVLEHLPDPVAELKRVRALLAPGGQLFLQVPNVESWQAKILGRRWYGLDAPRHAVNYSRRGLAAVMSRAGFRITHHKRFSLRDNSPAWVSSLLPALDPIRRRMAGSQNRGVHLLYSALVMALLPLALLEALCGRGGTLFVRAIRAEEV